MTKSSKPKFDAGLPFVHGRSLTTKTLIPLGCPQRDKWCLFSEVGIAVTSNHVGINFAGKSLETSCVCS